MNNSESMTTTGLLSVCIPTFNRAKKLARLLEQLKNILAVSPFRDRVHIIISNNASTDDTERVSRSFVSGNSELSVSYYAQATNVGVDKNCLFLYQNARTKYVWFCGDDDILFEQEFDQLCSDLEEYRPAVCLSSFRQPPYSDINRVFDCKGQRVEVVEDEREAVKSAVLWPKITAYVVVKEDVSEIRLEPLDPALQTGYWFMALSIFLVVNRSPRLLLRSSNLAMCDVDFRDIRFSPRVFAGHKQATLIALEGHWLKKEFDEVPSTDTDLAVVGCLLLHAIGKMNMDISVVREDFAYVRENWKQLALKNWKTTLKLAALFAIMPFRRSRFH